jgi:hypothetical protein
MPDPEPLGYATLTPRKSNDTRLIEALIVLLVVTLAAIALYMLARSR